MDSEFEKRLRCQPVKEIPPAWRAEILSAARKAQVAPHALLVTRHAWLSTLNQQLSTWLWPHPRAWAALAAAWVCVFILNASTHDTAPALAKNISAPSPEMITELKQQRKLYAELMGTGELRAAECPKETPERPRTLRVEIVAA